MKIAGSGSESGSISQRHGSLDPDPHQNVFPIYEHLFEYIGTQFPPPSSLLYGKMGSITLFFFQMGTLDMHDIGRQFTLFHFLLQ